MQKLINYIQQFVNLDSQTIKALEKHITIEHYNKNQNILECGQWCNKIWFIDTGMVRKFYLHDGKEVSSWIHTENEIFTSLQNYWTQTQSTEYLQTCETTRLFSISKASSIQLDTFPAMKTFSRKLIEQEMVKVEAHSRELRNLDSKEKYAYFCQIAPEVVKRAKLGHIASILGITQETLSRIRSS